MSSKIGLLPRLSFLQDIVSYAVSSLNPTLIHNVGKYLAISKAFYVTSIEQLPGDYLEFGVFTGSSLCHAMRCHKKSLRYAKEPAPTRFFGFDSFEGFGEVEEIDNHPFFEDSNFSIQYEKVKKRIRPFQKDLKVELIKGFYNESLKNGPQSLGLEKARIIFIDCDTYTGSKDAFKFCQSIVQNGTIIILDDWLSYNGSNNAGVAKAFNEFVDDTKLEVREISTYGIGSAMFVVSHVSNHS